MPHFITNRPRRHDLISTKPTAASHFTWESLSAIAYLIGGALFIIGSIFFLPEYTSKKTIGLWAYIIGSGFYLVVSVHHMCESIGYFRQHTLLNSLYLAELLLGVTYLAGTLLFVVGSVLFLPQFDLLIAGVRCFTIGSGLFVIGSCGAVLRSMQLPQPALSLLNATALCFTVGSVLFLVASIPYLWNLSYSLIKHALFTYTAWQYIIGGLLFFIGGALNYHRLVLAYRRSDT